MSLYRFTIADIQNGTWVWQLGDPDLPSILVTGFYFGAAAFCFACFRRVHFHSREDVAAVKVLRNKSRYWLAISIALAFLGVNKQADFQSLFEVLAKETVVRLGFYGARRVFQLLFLGFIALCSVCILAAIARLIRNWGWSYKMAAVGLLVLAIFICIRAGAANHFEKLAFAKPITLCIETLGLTIISAAAVLLLKTHSLNGKSC